jgi:hypothetical protein
MNEEFEEENESMKEKLLISLIQTVGTLVGYAVVITLNVFEQDIDIHFV